MLNLTAVTSRQHQGLACDAAGIIWLNFWSHLSGRHPDSSWLPASTQWEVLTCLETFKRMVDRGNAGVGNPMGDRNGLKNLVMSGWDAEAALQSQEKSCQWQEGGDWPYSPRKAPWAPGQTFGSSWASRNLRQNSSLLIITGT